MIGDLYDANNVVVGQAAVLVAPNGTPLPDFKNLNLADPFDPTPFVSYSVAVVATSSYTLSYAGGTTAALTDTSTPAAIATALEAIPGVGAGNVTVTGTGTAYTVLFTEAVASLASVLTSTTTSGSATVTGGLWVPVGATDQGWTYGTNKSTQKINIEEQSTEVGTTINTQSVTIAGALSEDISRTLALAYNGVLTSSAPSATEPGYDTIELTDDVVYYAVALIAVNSETYPRIVYAPKWSQLANTTTAFRRATKQRMYPVDFATACKPSQIQVFNITSPKT